MVGSTLITQGHTDMDSNHSLLEILKTVSLFSGFSEDEYAKVIASVKPCRLSLGDVIVHEGDSGETMYLVADGRFEVWKNDGAGGRITIGFLVSGSYIGELSLIDHLPRSATVEAICDSFLYELHRSDFTTILASDPLLGNKFYANCLKETMSRFRNIVTDFTFSQSHLKTQTAVLDEINTDLESAKSLQRFFINSDYLDSTPLLPGGIKQSYLYQPCFDIGGDFISIMPVGEKGLSVIIADVAGHGITASLATGIIKSAFSIYGETLYDRPSELIAKMNVHMCTVMKNYFATCFYAYIDLSSKTIRMAKAGHPYPLILKKSTGDFLSFASRGTALGFFPDSVFTEQQMDFESGDQILFYTDGITEQADCRQEMFGEERVMKLLRSLTAAGEQDKLRKIFEEMKRFSGKKTFDDDITMLLLEI